MYLKITLCLHSMRNIRVCRIKAQVHISAKSYPAPEVYDNDFISKLSKYICNSNIKRITS